MMDDENQRIRAFWDSVADDWRIQVGMHGDANRRLHSDPVLWRMVGDPSGRRVLDAGCGTGYLTRKLADAGARVTGVDLSDAMIAIARTDHPALDFRVDSIAELRTLADAEVDLIVSNYVLMDTPDLDAALRAFARVLKPGGEAVVVFSHPCFPQGSAEVSGDGAAVRYLWTSSYFEPHRREDPPWGHFTSPFIWFHRPLSAYWKAFQRAGLPVLAFEEPHITPDRNGEADDPGRVARGRMRPYSVAFRLGKAVDRAV